MCSLPENGNWKKQERRKGCHELDSYVDTKMMQYIDGCSKFRRITERFKVEEEKDNGLVDDC